MENPEFKMDDGIETQVEIDTKEALDESGSKIGNQGSSRVLRRKCKASQEEVQIKCEPDLLGLSPIINESDEDYDNEKQKSKSAIKTHSCKFCKKKFRYKSKLTYHLQLHIGNDKTDLDPELLIKEKSRPHQCTVCGKTFVRKSHLNVHFRIHSGEKPYSCDLCEKRFNCKNNLNFHRKLHSGIRPHICEFCGQNFSVKSNLVVHLRLHSGIKPFSCGVCSKNFAVKSNLIVHMRTHTNDKPYKCNICFKEFAVKTNLNVHRKKHITEINQVFNPSVTDCGIFSTPQNVDFVSLNSESLPNLRNDTVGVKTSLSQVRDG